MRVTLGKCRYTVFHSEQELGRQDFVINSRSTFVLCFSLVVVVVAVDMVD